VKSSSFKKRKDFWGIRVFNGSQLCPQKKLIMEGAFVIQVVNNEYKTFVVGLVDFYNPPEK